MKPFEDPQLRAAAVPRVAVVGAGIAGLACAWLLSRHAHVTLFEAERRPGGHTNTVDVSVGGHAFPVDTGFLVFNQRTYPNLCALFGHLGIDAVASDMSFAVSLEQPALEWAGSDLGSVFAQRGNLLRGRFWGMLRDILRFNRDTTRLARQGSLPADSLGGYLQREGYGEAFLHWYLLPMAAAIWSCPTATMLDYPLATFVRFCHNHGLLQIFDRPRWLSVRGGARRYVEALLREIPDVRLGCPVHGVRRDEAGVWVSSPAGQERFDQLVLACHSDQALRILGPDARPEEARILGAVRYQPNRALLHTDPGLLPRRPRVWSAWNYLCGPGQGGEAPVSVSYLLNRLQPLPVETPVVVTLNPFREPRPERVLAEFDYAHPVFDTAAIAAQEALVTRQGQLRTWFAGAWTGYGFHEDGLRSALAVAGAMGVAAPWQASTERRLEVVG